MKTAIILAAALSAAPASQPPIHAYALQPGQSITCTAEEGCIAMTNSEMLRLIERLKCSPQKGGST